MTGFLSRARGRSGFLLYTVQTCIDLFFVLLFVLSLAERKQSPPASRAWGAHGVIIAFGTLKLHLKFFLMTLLEYLKKYIYNNNDNNNKRIDPALLNLHRRKCETSMAEVNSLSLPMPLPPPPPTPPSPGKWCSVDLQAGELERRKSPQLASRAPGQTAPCRSWEGGRGGQETLKAFCSVPLVCFPFVYTTLYSWESWPPYSEHPPQQGLASNRAISQYHTWIFLFGFVLFCFVLFLSLLCIVVINTRSICWMYINILCYYFCFLEMSEVFFFFFLIYVGLKKKKKRKKKTKFR